MTFLLLIAAGLSQLGCFAGLLLLGDLKQHIPEALGLFGSSFLLFVLMLALLNRNDEMTRARSHSPEPGRIDRHLWTMLAIALLCRAVMWPAPASLSDDIYRYVWEGTVITAGHNPFALPPESAELAPLRSPDIYPHITRKNLTAVYPPLAQHLFAAGAWLRPSVATTKGVFILFDLATIAVLLLTLRRLRLNLRRSAVYALNPLVIVEFSCSGHLDSAGIFFMMLALYLCLQRRALWGAAALGASFLGKFIPVLFLPALLQKKRWAETAVFTGVVIAGYLPFLDAGPGLFRALAVYAENWVFNSALHSGLMSFAKHNQIARIIAAGIFTACAAWIYYGHFRTGKTDEPLQIYHTSFMLLAALLLCSPVLFPWYVCWVVPFLVLFPVRAWIFFTGAVFLSYWVLHECAASGLWKEKPAVLILQYVPFFVLLLHDRYKQKSMRRNHAI